MMGAGKSTIGRSLAEEAGRTFWDTDALLVRRMGRPIPQLFRIYGEDTFRDHETSILRSLEPADAVLATGGGIVIRPANWTELRRLGITIHLDVCTDVLLERIAKSRKKRPLLDFEDWRERYVRILEGRKPLYEQADLQVQLGDETTEDAVRKILTRLKETDLA